MEELIGKEIYGFRFKRLDLHYSPSMDIHIGKIGTIIEYCNDETDNIEYFTAKFENGEAWSYPYPEILDHLVDERTVDELLTEMKQLTSELWKMKI